MVWHDTRMTISTYTTFLFFSRLAALHSEMRLSGTPGSDRLHKQHFPIRTVLLLLGRRFSVVVIFSYCWCGKGEEIWLLAVLHDISVSADRRQAFLHLASSSLIAAAFFLVRFVFSMAHCKPPHVSCLLLRMVFSSIVSMH